MSDKWFQFWVRHSDPLVNQIALMKICDPVLQMFTSVPKAPYGTPITDADGTIEIRSYKELGFSMAKQYLIDQGFIIVREVVNE